MNSLPAQIFIACELLFFSSLLLRYSSLWIADLFLLLAGIYHMVDWFLLSKLKIRLKPALFPLLLHPASFLSSVKKLKLFPLPLFLFGILLLLFFALPPFLLFLKPVHPIFFAALTLAFGIDCFLQTPKEGSFLNPLFLLQQDLLGALLKKREKPSSFPPFSNEESRFLSSEFPLLRLTLNFKGPKQFDIPLGKKEKPHLIFVILESFRAKNIGCMGAKVPLSPHFDELAKEGLLWTQFHAAGNLTNRCSLASLFGVPPASQDWHLGKYVNIPLVGLPQILEPYGYHPALIQGGSLAFDHGVEFFQGHGFKTLLGKRDIENKMKCNGTSWGVFDEYLMPFAADWLQNQKQPTFLTLFSITNHHPWKVPSDWTPPSTLPSCPYLQTFAYTDWALGLFIEELKKKGLLEKSILFIFGDHGQELEDRDPHFEINSHLYQDNIHVPFLIYAKNRIQQPKRCDLLSSQIDLLPTVLDLLQIPGPHHSLGKSLLRKHPSPIFFNASFDPPLKGCRKENWKLVLQKTKAELFNLDTDPEEKENLAGQKPEIVESLKKLSLEQANLVDHLYLNKKFAPLTPSSPNKEVLHLDFSQSLKITDEVLVQAARSSPHLTSLSLSGCMLVTDEGISQLLQLCPWIEKLNLEGLDEITGENWPAAPFLMHLKALNCPKLGGKRWIEWLSDLSSLAVLQLGSASITDEDLLRLSQSTAATSLLSLQFSGLEEITDQGLKPLLQAAKTLEILSLEDCPKIGNDSLKALSSPIFHQLILNGCPLLTDSGLQNLHPLPLKLLALKNCRGLTQEGFNFFKTKTDLRFFR